MDKEARSKAPASVLAFHHWMLENGWCRRVVGAQTLYHRSNTYNQWPPDEEITPDELLIRFFGY